MWLFVSWGWLLGAWETTAAKAWKKSPKRRAAPEQSKPGCRSCHGANLLGRIRTRL